MTEIIGKVRAYSYKVKGKRNTKNKKKLDVKFKHLRIKLKFKIKAKILSKIKNKLKVKVKKIKKYYIDTFDEKGERIRIYGFEKQSVALSELAKMTAEKVNDNFIFESKDFTFSFLAKNCLSNFCKTLKASTYKSYLSIYQSRFEPFFGKKRFENITASTLNNYYISLREDGLSEKTIYNHRAFLSTIFRFNIDDRKITRNPVNSSVRIEFDTEEVIPYTLEEQALLLESAKSFKDAYYIIKIFLETGMRRGELVAFDLQRVDRLKRQYKLRYSSYDKQLVTPKTKQGKRNIDLSMDALKTIDDYIRIREVKSNFLFSAPDGGLRCADVLGDIFERVKAKAGITHGSIHTLRHTYASNQIAKGRHPKYICVQMGHFSICITMDIYGHLFPEILDDYNKPDEFNKPVDKNILELSIDEIEDEETQLKKQLQLLQMRKAELDEKRKGTRHNHLRLVK